MPAYVGVILNNICLDKYPNKPKTGWKPAGSVNFRGSRKPAGGKGMRLRRSRAASRPVNIWVKNP